MKKKRNIEKKKSINFVDENPKYIALQAEKNLYQQQMYDLKADLALLLKDNEDKELKIKEMELDLNMLNFKSKTYYNGAKNLCI